jgi:hypothetical protein
LENIRTEYWNKLTDGIRDREKVYGAGRHVKGNSERVTQKNRG